MTLWKWYYLCTLQSSQQTAVIWNEYYHRYTAYNFVKFMYQYNKTPKYVQSYSTKFQSVQCPMFLNEYITIISISYNVKRSAYSCSIRQIVITPFSTTVLANKITESMIYNIYIKKEFVLYYQCIYVDNMLTTDQNVKNSKNDVGIIEIHCM